VRTQSSIQTSGTLATDDFTINWDAVPGAATYDVWVNRLTSGTSQYFRNVSVATNSVAVSDFAPGRYAIWVNSQTAAGFSGLWSQQGLVTVSVPVSGLNVTGGSISSTPTLTWNAVAGATNYDVWVDNLTTNQSEVVRNTSVNGTSLQLDGLAAGSYRAWVRSRDENGGNYAWSGAFDFEHQATARVLTPTGTGNSDTPLFTWTAVSGATRYELWVSNLNGSGRVIHEENLTANSFTPGSALSSGNYRIWIRAFDGSNATVGWSGAFDFSVAASSEAELESEQLLTSLSDGLFCDAADVLTMLDDHTRDHAATGNRTEIEVAQMDRAVERFGEYGTVRTHDLVAERLLSGSSLPQSMALPRDEIRTM